MGYELEYEKSYDGKVLTATPIKGHDSLPVLRLEVTPEELPSVIAHHRVRTMDITHPGITAYLFGKPGNVRIVHHDGEDITVDSFDAAMAHHRPGEKDMLRSAHAHFEAQKKAAPVSDGQEA